MLALRISGLLRALYSLRSQTKISKAHHNLVGKAGPASTSSVRQPETKIGRHARLNSIS